MPALLTAIGALALTGVILWLLKPHRSPWFAWAAALPPALVALWFALQLPGVAQGVIIQETYPWIPTLNLELALRLDGLALFFALIVTGVGTCIAFYTHYYFEHDHKQGYFYLLLFAFMACMLGLVLANDLLLLFVFWEGTSITSYLLIAFKSDYKGAVEGARRAIIVTSAGAFAMLGGMLLLGQAAGTFRIDAIVAEPGLMASPVFPVALVLILLGAFTKSAQFPFHFWLPGAMAAPTPASAFLHSATMVKAGIYLMARLHPAFAPSPLWFWTLLIVGAATMLLGSVSAIRYRDMKAVLAYTTISALGSMTLLLAFDAPEASLALTVTILAHALYKAPLFLTAGVVDHAMGTRDTRYLAGLWRLMPWAAAVAILAGLSMAGAPPTWGFLSKELLLEEFYQQYEHGAMLVGGLGFAAVVVMAVFTAGAIYTLVWEAFLRRRPDPAGPGEPGPAHLHHRPSFWFVFPALLLALTGALTPLWLPVVETVVILPAATVAGAPIDVHLKLWHGWTPVLITSLAILAAGVVLALLRRPVRLAFTHAPERLTGVYLYDSIVDAVYAFAYRLTTLIQRGPMPPQLAVTLVAAIVALLYALFQVDLANVTLIDSFAMPLIVEFLMVAVAIVAAVATVRARSRLSAIISLGVVGIAVTMFFVFYSAPDLALTQLLIEVLTVILLVLVFFRVKPDPSPPDTDRRALLRWALAIAMGVFGFGIVMVNTVYQVAPSISPYFLANSLPIGQGGNVVNVILVDIRGYDTLGEITVLGLAALGGYAVLRSPKLQVLRTQIARRLGPNGGTTAEAQPAQVAAPVAVPVAKVAEVGDD